MTDEGEGGGLIPFGGGDSIGDLTDDEYGACCGGVDLCSETGLCIMGYCGGIMGGYC